MDPRTSAQDVLRCRLCKTTDPVMYCDICNKHLCKTCVGEHISDESIEHKIVQFKKRGSTSICQKHFSKICELYCKQCNTPICADCVSSKEHNAHDIINIASALESKRDELQNDLKELEVSIYLSYQEIASNIPIQRANLKENSQKLAIALDKYRDFLHKEVDVIVKEIKYDLHKEESKCLEDLQKQEDEIKCIIPKITQSIADLKEFLKSNNASHVSAYKSRNAEFRKLPPKLTISLPKFTPKIVNKEQLLQQFGSLSVLSIKTEALRPINHEPRVITEIVTEYGNSNPIRSVSCLNDEEIWMGGVEHIIRLYNLQGELLKSIETKSGKGPMDIAVTRSGNLVYTDFNDKTLNIVKTTHIQELVRLLDWKPRSVCCTFSGDFLVIMERDDKKQTKVVRYSGHAEKQSIQYHDNGQPLYSFATTNIGNTKYITENRNLDICVADHWANAVVVVNQAGKLRFRYTGNPFEKNKEFNPCGITTDSRGRILTGEYYNNCVHILDQDGNFLSFIDNCDLNHPNGLCVDTGDNLFVAELISGKVKKIQYYK